MHNVLLQKHACMELYGISACHIIHNATFQPQRQNETILKYHTMHENIRSKAEAIRLLKRFKQSSHLNF